MPNLAPGGPAGGDTNEKKNIYTHQNFITDYWAASETLRTLHYFKSLPELADI